MTNSRRKGADYEREIAKELNEMGFTARRGQQYSGANGDPDVVCEELKNFHLELKRRAKSISAAEMYKFMEQARTDAKKNEVPVVVHRVDGEKSLVTMDFKTWVKLAKCYSDNARCLTCRNWSSEDRCLLTMHLAEPADKACEYYEGR